MVGSVEGWGLFESGNIYAEKGFWENVNLDLIDSAEGQFVIESSLYISSLSSDDSIKASSFIV